jgi:tRNA G37 N-methylase Trm5
LETCREGSSWSPEVVHIERVKSYGPRVDHLVIDLLCRPDASKMLI